MSAPTPTSAVPSCRIGRIDAGPLAGIEARSAVLRGPIRRGSVPAVRLAVPVVERDVGPPRRLCRHRRTCRFRADRGRCQASVVRGRSRRFARPAFPPRSIGVSIAVHDVWSQFGGIAVRFDNPKLSSISIVRMIWTHGWQADPMAKLGKPTPRETLHVADCVDIFRVHGAACAERVADRVIVEEPVTIMVDRVGSFTVMCTPSDIEALAVGFVYSEGMIRSADDVLGVHRQGQSAERHRDRDPGARPVRHCENLVVASSCGLCGVRNIQKHAVGGARLPALAGGAGSSLLLDVTEKLRPMQTTFALTGSSHAAASVRPRRRHCRLRRGHRPAQRAR